MLSYEEAQVPVLCSLSYEEAQAQVLCSLDRLCAYSAEHQVFHVFNAHLFTKHEPFDLQFLQFLHIYQFSSLETIQLPYLLDEFVNCIMEFYNQVVLFHEYDKLQTFSQTSVQVQKPMSENSKTETESKNMSFSDLSLDTTEIESSIPAGSLKSEPQHKPPEFVNANDEVIFATLKTAGTGMTRSELVDSTGIARSTIFDSLHRLMLRGLVKCYPQHLALVGRPKVYFESCTGIVTSL